MEYCFERFDTGNGVFIDEINNDYHNGWGDAVFAVYSTACSMVVSDKLRIYLMLPSKYHEVE